MPWDDFNPYDNPGRAIPARYDPDEDGPVGVDELGDLVMPSQVCDRRVVGHREHPVPGWREDYDVPIFETDLPERWVTA